MLSDSQSLIRRKGSFEASEKDKYIKIACNREGIYDKLEDIQERLAVCKKSLNDFLDVKRRIFPRFYFTSESDLLDILSNEIPIENHQAIMLLVTRTLTLVDDPNGGPRPLCTNWITSNGIEQVDFDHLLYLKVMSRNIYRMCMTTW